MNPKRLFTYFIIYISDNYNRTVGQRAGNWAIIYHMAPMYQNTTPPS